jgi:hypothetical protein
MKGLAMTALLIAAPFYRQTVSEVSNALGIISAQDKSLSLSYTNLRGMMIGREAQLVLSVADSVWAFKLGTQVVIAVGSILPNMREKTRNVCALNFSSA